jgi:hypothetical protein
MCSSPVSCAKCQYVQQVVLCTVPSTIMYTSHWVVCQVPLYTQVLGLCSKFHYIQPSLCCVQSVITCSSPSVLCQVLCCVPSANVYNSSVLCTKCHYVEQSLCFVQSASMYSSPVLCTERKNLHSDIVVLKYKIAVCCSVTSCSVLDILPACSGRRKYVFISVMWMELGVFTQTMPL